MILGFTGTREGMTPDQKIAVRRWCARNAPKTLHHGCCIGADEDIVTILADSAVVIGHPPSDGELQSKYATGMSELLENPAEYLSRNQAIVKACDTLLATPKGPEELRSGTWSTIRYARRKVKTVVIVWPDGRVE